MSDDPASKHAFRWELRQRLVERLRIPWDGIGDMGNKQRADAAIAISTMMDEIEAWRRCLQKAERDIAELIRDRDEAERLARRNALLVAEIETVRVERDEARVEVCRLIVAGDFSVHENETKEHVAFERGWDCFKETP